MGLLAGAAILKESLSTWQSIGIAWIAAALLFILVVSRRQA
ncbi:hypothetical protein CBA19C6_07385 [Cupriavidus pauculus]|nr:hypothetical protein CBA19C6_07385 [Cupriavidus pauculus]